MRRLLGLLTPLILITLLTLPTRTMGKGRVRTVTPPITEIELTWKQPPSGLPSKIFSVGGQLDLVQGRTQQRGIRWIEETPGSIPDLPIQTPQHSSPVVFKHLISIRGTLTYPYGHQESIRGEHWGQDRDCLIPDLCRVWYGAWPVYAHYRDVKGQRTHTWGLDYPPCPAVGWVGHGSGWLLLVMGLVPEQSVTIHFTPLLGKMFKVITLLTLADTRCRLTAKGRLR
jgi:hypothetical protein